MTDDRPTVRPVTLSRLVEVSHLCRASAATTADVEARLGVSRSRARETLLEATRIGLIWRDEAGGGGDSGDAGDEESEAERFRTTDAGGRLLAAVRDADWQTASGVLYEGSPHYRAFHAALAAVGPATLSEVLTALAGDADGTTASPYTFNETGVEVVGDWAERLGSVARNAFTGAYYLVDPPAGVVGDDHDPDTVPERFPRVLLAVFDDLETTAGVNLTQRYLSIPRLREHVCERLGCRRAAFDDALVELVGDHVGQLELSGAPVDTGAKEARYGIKRLAVAGAAAGGGSDTTTGTDSDTTADAETDGDATPLVSTTQSTTAVMDGVEQFGKRYYYLAVHDRGFVDEVDEETATDSAAAPRDRHGDH